MKEKSQPSDASSAIIAWLRERSQWRPDAATPVDTLARLLGLDVATFDAALHPGVWGYLEPGEDLVFLRAGLPEAARRFTLAHEIGHAVLHREHGPAAVITGAPDSHIPSGGEPLDACQGSDVESPDLSDETLQSGQMYSARAVVEREANAFAVELLMPEGPFLDAYLALCARARSSGRAGGPTRLLAKRFGVSEDAALRRLQGLLAPAKKGEDASSAMSLAPSVAEDMDQRMAARLESPALVMAGPGSGKTSTLVARIVHLIEERGAKPDEILALTFSRKAAEELRERVSSALAHNDARSTPYISTIHHFCLELLGRHGHLIGLSPGIRLASEIELYFLLRQVMRKAHLRHLSSPYAPDLYVRDIQQAISRAKDDLLGPADVSSAAESALRQAEDDSERDAAERQREFATIFEAYQRLLMDQKTVDYGDVIALTARLLGERREIAEDVSARWPYMLVDEYQDINRAMDTILRELVSTGSGLWAVGDANQAIYRFRGAEPGIVYRFGDTFAGAHVVSLVRNYRSRRDILDTASAFADHAWNALARSSLQATRDETDTARPVVSIASNETDEGELAGMARAIEERHQRGRAYRDQVVLLRTRRQVEQVVAGLSARGIPTYTLASAMDRDVVQRCVAVMSLLSEPSGAGLIRAGLQLEHAFDRDDAIAMLREARRQRKPLNDKLMSASEVAGVSRAGRGAMRRLGRMLSVLRSATSVASGISLYCFSLTRIGAQLLTDRERNVVDVASLRRLLDIARMFDSWRAVDTSAQDALSGAADWGGFAEFLRAASLLRLDTLDEMSGQGFDAVRVMTAHASKGLEFPVVYLPQLVNRRFPLTSRPPIVARVIQARDALVEENGGLSDEASLFYVAMTRARDELVLSYARRYGRAFYTVSPFLDPIQQAMGERVASERWDVTDVPPERPDAAQVVVDSPVTQPPRLDDADPLFDIAELETYQRCPRQYAYRYVDKLWSPAALMTLYSRATRRASQDVLRAFSQSRQSGNETPTRDDALAIVEERWRAALEDEQANMGGAEVQRNVVLEAYYLRQAQATIENLWTSLTQRENRSDRSSALLEEAHSRQVTVNVGELQIRGEIEIISASSDLHDAEESSLTERIGEAWGVVLYQGSRSSGSPSLRDLFVEVAAQQEAPGEGRGNVIVRNLSTGAETPVNLSARQRARLTREAQEAVAGIKRRDFHANPDEWLCHRCPFAAACPV